MTAESAQTLDAVASAIASTSSHIPPAPEPPQPSQENAPLPQSDHSNMEGLEESQSTERFFLMRCKTLAEIEQASKTVGNQCYPTWKEKRPCTSCTCCIVIDPLIFSSFPPLFAPEPVADSPYVPHEASGSLQGNVLCCYLWSVNAYKIAGITYSSILPTTAEFAIGHTPCHLDLHSARCKDVLWPSKNGL